MPGAYGAATGTVARLANNAPARTAVKPEALDSISQEKLPAPARTVDVSSSARLATALNGAQPGDHIVLAAGAYHAFSIAPSGKDGKPIVIRAADTLKAKVNGSVAIQGDDVWVLGVDFANGAGVTLRGARNRISRSRFKSNGTAIHIASRARHAIIDHNEITSAALPSTRNWHGIKIDGNAPECGHRVFRNYLHDCVRDDEKGDDNSALGLYGRGGVPSGVLVEYNLFQNWLGDGETISIKGHGVTIRFNTCVGCREFNNRWGKGNVWNANWIEDSVGLRIHDSDGVLLGNRLGKGCRLRVMAGSVAPPDFVGFVRPPNHPAAWHVLLAGNQGPLIIGYAFPNHTFPAKDIVVEAHQGSVDYGQHYERVTLSPTTARVIPTAFKLNAADVGPMAPTAPRL